jgi:ribosomal protein L11 methylase PrmA
VLVLSGLLEADAAEVTAAYASWFDISSFGSRDGWIGLAGVRLVHDLP